jgi:hypothetical protein
MDFERKYLESQKIIEEKTQNADLDFNDVKEMEWENDQEYHLIYTKGTRPKRKKITLIRVMTMERYMKTMMISFRTQNTMRKCILTKEKQLYI